MSANIFVCMYMYVYVQLISTSAHCIKKVSITEALNKNEVNRIGSVYHSRVSYRSTP
jgi:hypothetical protein